MAARSLVEEEQPIVLCRKRVGENAEWLLSTGYADAMCSCVVSCKQECPTEKRIFAAPGLRADTYADVDGRNAVLDVAAVGHIADDPENIFNRVQREGKDAFARGEMVLFDPDTGMKAENPTPAGRVAIEFWTPQGYRASSIFVHQSDKWAKIFGHIVAISPRAKALEPELEVGMRIVFERCAADQTIDFCVPSGGTQLLASFPVLYIGDIAAVYTSEPAMV